MDESVKAELLEFAEEAVKLSGKHFIMIAKAYAASTESAVDDSVVAGVELVYNSFLKDLAEKINPAD